MKRTLPLIAAFVCMLGLSGCGGGSAPTPSTPVVKTEPTYLSTPVVVGTGAAAAAGKTVTITYTGWLYNTNALLNKGGQFGSGSSTFVLGAATPQAIKGIEKAVALMKVGGMNTVVIPAADAYGITGSGDGKVPANAPLIMDITLTAVSDGVVVPDNQPSTQTTTDLVVGSGTTAVAGKTTTVTYTGWLYSATAADHKGTQFNTGTFSFVVGNVPPQVIPGFDVGVLGMKVGGSRSLVIPASAGYGPTGSVDGKVPPNTALVIEVALGAVFDAPPTTLVQLDTVVGTGAAVGATDKITVRYTGWLYDPTAPDHHGTLFDQTTGSNTFQFTMGTGVIVGWSEGIVGMKVGGKRTLTIPPGLAYGSAGSAPKIPSDATLIFDIELISIP